MHAGAGLPETIDRYEVLQKLASGGMAELFLAKQSGMEGFEKVVVIKRILPHLATDQEFVSMFLDEARIAAKLSHPNVVQIYDLGRADDTYYIAMEYVSGRNVASIIKKAQSKAGSIPVEHTARVIAGMCDGLFYAHTRKDYDGKALNIIHRDISPQNILVSFAGGVKLVDFGIAKASTQLAQTRAGVLKGKYSYMSPEQVRGDKIDGRSDLFAVGICMYEMLTAQRPFERENSLKTLKAIVQEKPLNPRDLNPGVPVEIVKILSKSLEKDPNRRYANAQEMQLALEDWLDRSPNKSNNVRISRYLYDLFDDELNAEGGTLEVKGIGEIIIPTGTGDAPKALPAQEEIPEGTVRAALGEVAAAHQKKQQERGAKAEEPPPPAQAPAPSPEEEFDAGTDPSMAPPPGAGGADDEMDGATIPVYDLAAYEQERLRRHHGPGAPGVDDGSADAAGGFDDSPTMNMDAAARNGLLQQIKAAGGGSMSGRQKAPPTRVRTEIADPPRRTSGPVERLPVRPEPSVRVDAPELAPPERSNGESGVPEDEVAPGLAGGQVRPAAEPMRPALERAPRREALSHQGTETVPPDGGMDEDSGAPTMAMAPLTFSSPDNPPVPAADPSAPDNSVVTSPEQAVAPQQSGEVAPAEEAPPAADPTEAIRREKEEKKKADVERKAREKKEKSDRRAAAGPSWATRNRSVLIVVAASVLAVVLGTVVVVAMVGDADVPAPTQPVLPAVEMGHVKITSVPTGCHFMVNGKRQEEVTPIVVTIPVGPATIRVLAPDGYEDKVNELQVGKDKRENVHVVLEKKK